MQGESLTEVNVYKFWMSETYHGCGSIVGEDVVVAF